MKRNSILLLTFVLTGGLSDSLRAQPGARTTGIGIRGTFWNMDNFHARIHVIDDVEYGNISVGGGGGWLYFFSRMNDYTFLEFGLGAIGTIEAESHFRSGEQLDIQGIIPLVLGLRHQLVGPTSQSALQPYLQFGGGPYWLTWVSGRETAFGDEFVVNTQLKPGAYAGGGLYFMLSSWFGLNFDVKYHFVDFNIQHERSGYEYGLGISFLWGRYKPSHRNRY